MTIIRDVETLRAVYDAPISAASITKVTHALTPEYRAMIQRAPFVALATVGPEGLDCSPRGDLGGVVRVVDQQTLALPDWRGNNRIDSLVNIVRDPRVALMFLVPGSTTTMRVNGKAVISVDPELLDSFEMDGRHPRSVALVSIDEVYFQCARALVRAELWNPARHADPQSVPTAGEMLRGTQAGFDAETYDREWPARAANTMW